MWKSERQIANCHHENANEKLINSILMTHQQSCPSLSHFPVLYSVLCCCGPSSRRKQFFSLFFFVHLNEGRRVRRKSLSKKHWHVIIISFILLKGGHSSLNRFSIKIQCWRKGKKEDVNFARRNVAWEFSEVFVLKNSVTNHSKIKSSHKK